MLKGKRFFSHKTATEKIKNPGIFPGKVQPLPDAASSFFAAEIYNFRTKGKAHIPEIFGKTRNLGKSTRWFGGGHKGALSLLPVKYSFVYQGTDGLSGGHTTDMELFTEFPFRRNDIPRLIHPVIHQSEKFLLKLIVKGQGTLTLKLLHSGTLSCYAVVMWYIPHNNSITPLLWKVKQRALLRRRALCFFLQENFSKSSGLCGRRNSFLCRPPPQEEVNSENRKGKALEGGTGEKC